MPYEQASLSTRDGNCVVHLFTPVSERPSPAIIFYPDAGGIRPAALAMAERLSEAGYAVLLPDIFYRYGPYGPLDPKEVFKGDVRAILGPLMATTGNAKSVEDTHAFLAYLDAHEGVLTQKIGAVGFCMGGGMAIAAGGTWPDRFAAVASFHGGNLASDAADSPHTYVAPLEAELYIGAAENDSSYPAAMAEQLEKALADAQVRFTTRTYPAAHGWMMTDFPVYDERAAEEGWRDMLALFARNLR